MNMKLDENGELKGSERRYFSASFGNILSGRRRVIINSIPYHDSDDLVTYYLSNDIDEMSRFLSRIHSPFLRGYGILDWCAPDDHVKHVDEFPGLRVDWYDLTDGFSWTGRKDTMFLEVHWLADEMFQAPYSADGLWQLKWQTKKDSKVKKTTILRKVREACYVSGFTQVDKLSLKQLELSLNPCHEIPLCGFGEDGQICFS